MLVAKENPQSLAFMVIKDAVSSSRAYIDLTGVLIGIVSGDFCSVLSSSSIRTSSEADGHLCFGWWVGKDYVSSLLFYTQQEVTLHVCHLNFGLPFFNFSISKSRSLVLRLKRLIRSLLT